MLGAQVARGLGVDKHSFNVGIDPQSFLYVTRLPIFLIKWLLLLRGSVHDHSATGKQPAP